ncbi:retrotransposon hot spot protein (RHS), putative, partial [Trypanosoma cruzi]
MWRCCGRLHVALLRGGGLDCFPTGVASAAAWRADHRAVRVPRPTPLGTAGGNSRDCPLEPAAS